MSEAINRIMIAKKDIVVVPKITGRAKNVLSKEEVSTMICNFASLGYVPNEGLYKWFCEASRDVAIKTYKETMNNLEELLGYREYRPMYPNFPQQVIEASSMELFINALLHYYTSGEYKPLYEVTKRKQYRASIKEKVLKVGSMQDFLNFANNIMMSKTSISADDRLVLELMFIELQATPDDIPLDMPHKENKAIVWAMAINAFGLINCMKVKEVFTTSTDILRLMVALSNGDVSLAENTRFRSFKRAERRLFMEMLSNLKYSAMIADMDKYADRWKRVGERLHPSEFKHYATVQKAFNEIRDNANIATFNGTVAKLMADGKTFEAASFLCARPGELARKLDLLLRKSNKEQVNAILDIFESFAKEVSTPVLLQLRAHFLGRAVPAVKEAANKRVFFPKGSLTKAYVIDDTLETISYEACDRVVNACNAALLFNYGQREAMGNVYIDPSLKGYLVPFSQRSASRSIKTVVRGSRMAFDKKCKIIRSFIWWKNGEERTDLDLSAIMLDENFENVGQVSYTNLRTSDGEAVHSGDIVDAPNGACEFIDIDLEKFESAHKNRKVRYVAFNIYSFTHQPFVELPECFMGWMERKSMGHRGEIYDARTVKNKIDLTGNTQVNMPMVVDLVNKEIIWLDLALTNKSMYNNTESAKASVATLIKGLVNVSKANIYDLVKLNAQARGTIVKSKKDADIIFSVTEGVTPFDVDEFMAKYI